MSSSAVPEPAVQGVARLVLATPRLRLVAGGPALASAVCRFLQRNRAHLRPWDPPLAPDFLTLAAQMRRLQQGLVAFQSASAFRYWLLPARDVPESDGGITEVLGSIHFSQVTRGAFHNATLGYALDQAHVGQGLMTEALQAGLAEMFSPRVNLHRVQAAWRPENHRSGAVLARLGFRPEGLARDYLFIDGAWRDHQLAAITNPDFVPPADW